MKILHVCLGERYVDGYGYQENIITKIHKQMGYEVYVLASTLTLIEQKPAFVKPNEYINEYGIPIKRIPYVPWLPIGVASKLRLYRNTYECVNKIRPDIIFIHGASFMDVRKVAKYAKKHPVTIFVDNHGDYINSGKNWVSRNLLHRGVYRWCYKQIIPYTKKFYGTLPIRCKYLSDVYGVPEEKIELLPMGIDLSNLKDIDRTTLRKKMRVEYGYRENDFVIIMGGKLEKRKNTIDLIKAVVSIGKPDVKLFLFGSISDNIKEEAKDLIEKHKEIVTYGGWAKWDEIYKYLLVGDVCIFPGTHSAIWEQAVGIGMPCIFKRWENITHVDLGGNCDFIDDVNQQTITESILKLFNDRAKLTAMRIAAETKGPVAFSYEEIAKRAIKN